ncbi:MAG: hypothetical protein R3Y43_03515 [Alphaproteobacteria bacterium]
MKFEDLKNLAYKRVVEMEADFVVDALKESKSQGEFAKNNEDLLRGKYREFFVNKHSEAELKEKLLTDDYKLFTTTKQRDNAVSVAAGKIDDGCSIFAGSDKVLREAVKARTQQKR